MTPVDRTAQEFDAALAECRAVFVDKFRDYGASWRIMRPASMTDQIFIKANRLRSIQEKGRRMVNEGIREPFIAIVNYGIMALIQLDKGHTDTPERDTKLITGWYDSFAEASKQLMCSKNHDYDEAWRSMRIESITDVILTKIFRIKQIEDHDGTTYSSEGIDANYQDIINYALFALIRLNDERAEPPLHTQR